MTKELERVKAELLSSRERGHQDLRALREKEATLRREADEKERAIAAMQAKGLRDIKEAAEKAGKFIKEKAALRDRIAKK